MKTYHAIDVHQFIEGDEVMNRIIEEASRMHSDDACFSAIRAASSAGDDGWFSDEFMRLRPAEQYHLTAKVDVHDSLSLSRSNFLMMLCRMLKEDDLGEGFFSMCVRNQHCDLDQDRICQVLVNPHLSPEILLCMFPLERTIEQCGFDDDDLRRLESRWGEVSSLFSTPPFDVCDGTIRDSEALIRHATRMRRALRAGDPGEALRIAVGTGSVEMYRESMRFSMPRWPMANFPRNEMAAYEAHLLMRAGMSPSYVRGLAPLIEERRYIMDSSKALYLKMFNEPIRESTRGEHTSLIEAIGMMSGSRDVDEVDALVIEYARRAADVVGGFEEDEVRTPDDADVVEWLASSDPFVVAMSCALMDPRMNSGQVSLSTTMSVIEDRWNDRAPVISSFFFGYDDEMLCNMIDPVFVRRQIEKHGGLHGGPVSDASLYDDLFEGLPPVVTFYHGTSAARFHQGLPELGILPIREIGLLSPRDMRNEEYEDRTSELDRVFVSRDPNYAATYGWKTTSQDAARGVETHPVLLAFSIALDEVLEFVRGGERVFDSLAAALIRLAVSTMPNELIPMVVTRERMPTSMLGCVIDISSAGDGGDVTHLLPDEFLPFERPYMFQFDPVDGGDDEQRSSNESQILEWKAKTLPSEQE